jgi:phosphopantetheine adenylyltransferase
MLIHITTQSLGYLIEDSAARVQTVTEFLHAIKPSLQHRVTVINDPFGPPAVEPNYNAIVVSSETISGAKKINALRQAAGFEPLAIVVTRRTEASSLCSSALRAYIHSKRQQQLKA